MRAEHTNEVEERRVIRVLAGLADNVPAIARNHVDEPMKTFLRVGGWRDCAPAPMKIRSLMCGAAV